jgi:hypothetical protein
MVILKPFNSVNGFSVGETPTPIILANADINAATVRLEGNIIVSNTGPLRGIFTDNIYYSNGNPWQFKFAAGSNTQVQFNIGGNLATSPNLTFNNTTSTLSVVGTIATTNITSSNINVGNISFGNITGNQVISNTVVSSNSVSIGNTQVGWASKTTNSIMPNQTIATIAIANVTGVEFLLKGEDSSGNKFVITKVHAVTNGTAVEYTTYGTVKINSVLGNIRVSKVGSNMELQVTPESSNAIFWLTQYRVI